LYDAASVQVAGTEATMTDTTQASSADADSLEQIDAWWRAANYLAVGQIYLLDNPLLREPLRLEHVKPRLLGHWGTALASTSSMRTSTG
jgi:xylulose-5-phosphate/fructose-6-phosphate phosphoketolase